MILFGTLCGSFQNQRCVPSTRYTILEFIGEGSFGKVAKCRAHNSSKLVAVKILKKEYFQDVEDEVSVWCLQQNFNYEFLG
uniref:Protein kinase domain-containing protein n=1 Tax=Gouania willdenowi TaxID=441366 RepID=A0A8C5FYR6_GOUWI